MELDENKQGYYIILYYLSPAIIFSSLLVLDIASVITINVSLLLIIIIIKSVSRRVGFTLVILDRDVAS